MKVLIVQQKMIGDVLTSTILFEAIKKEYPDSELYYVINSHTFAVVENNPFIDHFIFITPKIERNKFLLLTFLKRIRKGGFDVVIDVYGKLSSNLISVFSKAPIKSSYYKKLTAFMYSYTFRRLKTPQNNASLAIENRLKLLEPLKIGFSNISPKIYLKTNETLNAKKNLEHYGINLEIPIIMISALGSNLNKTYPLSYMAKLLDYMVQNMGDVQILFNYMLNQEKDARHIYQQCEVRTQSKIILDVFGKNLREFLSLTYHCRAVIGNEGGAINMAKALNIRTFSIFSPYLNRQNWFGSNEENKHMAIHISDYIKYSVKDKIKAKKNPCDYYLKLTPELIKPKLKAFLNTLD